jgi:Leucine-rich repeat (LRR) protein
LACDDNHLASLVVSNEANLTQLSCSSNWLTSLNVSSIAKLTRLDCSFNFLSSLDVSNNKLTILDCSYNSFLSAINLPKTTDTLSFNWDNLAKDCAASGTVQRAVNTTIDGTKPVSWNETIY